MNMSQPPKPRAVGDQAAADGASRAYRWLQRGMVLALALSCALALSLNLVDPDLWGHIRYAEDWLAEGELPRTASHTFTAMGYPWINHENLAELSLAFGYRHLGSYGLLVAKCLLGMGIVITLVRTAQRRGVHALLAWAIMLLVASNLTARFAMRPHLLSFLLFTTVLWLLDRAFGDEEDPLKFRAGWLWLLPVVFAVWVNSHGGFVAGLGIVGTYLGGRMIQGFVRLGRSAWPALLQLALVGVACVAATLANPYGLEMHRWLLGSLGRPRPEITEWASLSSSQPIFWQVVWLSVMAGVSLAATRRRRDWTQIAILVLVGCEGVAHLRFIPFFALLCGFWLPVHVQSALGRLRPENGAPLPTMRLSPRWRFAAMGAILLGIGLQSLALGRRLSDYPVYRNSYPVDAVQFMVDRQLKGKLVVVFHWAQYAIAAMAPDVQVAFDGRFRTCYPQQMVDMHFDFLLGENDGRRYRSPESGPIDGTRVLKYRSPDLVLLDRSYENPVEVMRAEAARENPRWVLLYRDQAAEIWGRRDRYDDPSGPDYFPLAWRLQDLRPQDAAAQWPALPRRTGGLPLAEQEQTGDASNRG